MPRITVSSQTVQKAIESVIAKLNERIGEKGDHSFVSSHEILGILAEEQSELVDAVRANDVDQVNKEAHDIAVAAIWAIASDMAGGLDW